MQRKDIELCSIASAMRGSHVKRRQIREKRKYEEKESSAVYFLKYRNSINEPYRSTHCSWKLWPIEKYRVRHFASEAELSLFSLYPCLTTNQFLRLRKSKLPVLLSISPPRDLYCFVSCQLHDR